MLWGGGSIQYKKSTIVIVILLLTISLIGGSYAFFSVIFKDTRTNENNGVTNFTTDNLSNATIISNIPNGVGSFLNTDIYPGHKEVLGLSVTGSGSVNSKSYFQFKYKVSENGLGNNVKISVYKSNKPIEITENHFNCVKKNEKIENSNNTKYFETCEEKDLGFLLEETTLNGGQEDIVIGRDSITILKENVDITKYYYVVVEFINKEESQNEDMNRKLVGKVEVELIPFFESDFANNINIVALSQNESWNQVETFSIHITSEKYNIVSMSEDLETWEELETKGKDITIEKTYTTNEINTYYFQDEVGNIKDVNIESTKVDNQKPTANLSVNASNNQITIDASSSKDNESGIKKYYYSFDGVNFEESIENKYSIQDTGIIYGIATESLKSMKTIDAFVKVEDKAGNTSNIKKASFERSGDNSTSLLYDETVDNNLRYVGTSPNNYVSFNNELWRVIGSFNNIDDGTGKKETRMKIMRAESIGSYSWDTSASNINRGWGVNDWNQADLMKLLNPGYESESVGGSLYWNRRSGTCYSGENNATKACSFINIGLLEETKSMIDNALWNIGTVQDDINALLPDWYAGERSSLTGKQCSGTSNRYCNDQILKKSTWIGKVGLISLSDFGYSIGTSERNACLSKSIANWGKHTKTEDNDCNEKVWLKSETNMKYLLSITPVNESATDFSSITSAGITLDHRCDYVSENVILPTIYLKSTVKITGGLGTSSSPFTLSVN